MPALSQNQQKLFGMVYRCQKTGECSSPSVKEMAKKISAKDVEDFARTKRDGLPSRVKENLFSSFEDFLKEEHA